MKKIILFIFLFSSICFSQQTGIQRHSGKVNIIGTTSVTGTKGIKANPTSGNVIILLDSTYDAKFNSIKTDAITASGITKIGSTFYGKGGIYSTPDETINNVSSAWLGAQWTTIGDKGLSLSAPAGQTGRLIEARIGATDKFVVGADGAITASGSINGFVLNNASTIDSNRIATLDKAHQQMTGYYDTLRTHSINGIRKFIVLLDQNGTDAPVMTILENTTGATITDTYDETGTYSFLYNGGAWPLKTIAKPLTDYYETWSNVYRVEITRGGTGYVEINCFNGTSLFDGFLSSAKGMGIEVTIYP